MKKALSNIKIALCFSLIYALFLLLAQVLMTLLYTPNAENWQSLYATIYMPLRVFIFPIFIIFFHRYFVRKKPDASFMDILACSLLIIFVSYCFEYLIGNGFYYGYFEELEKYEQKEQGIAAMIALFDGPGIPIFSPTDSLIIAPFLQLKEIVLTMRLWELPLVLANYPITILLIVLNFESLFLLFKKYKVNPWFALIPFFNFWILVRLAQKPTWWNILLYIPIIRRICLFFLNLRLAKDAKQGAIYAFGMTLLPAVFYGNIYFNDNTPNADRIT